MKIKAQISMVMNLDKCIGCHTCSITCKNTWTNREGAEYMYFNNVETKPGIGYPKHWEDQNRWKGGWILKDGKLQLATGSKGNRLMKLFFHPEQPELKDYFEPWTYDYETLIHSKRKNNQPVARPRSLITKEKMEIEWGPNWEDDLAGGNTARADVNLQKIGQNIALDFHDIFMKYLPRLCNHCLNPACVAACPSGAIYKRDEDGVVLISQDVCRGWRHCVPACPYKKIYYNWQTNKAEKCVFCYPRLENGLPQICADTCVGRMRYVGVLLYDMDKVEAVASTENPQEIYDNMLDVLLDPHDPAVAKAAKEQGIPDNWIKAAKESPVLRLIKEWQIALPLHAEYRTVPMVWYVPPMSPILHKDAASVHFPEAEAMRIPVAYLAQIFSAGNEDVIRRVLNTLLDLRRYMQQRTRGEATTEFDTKYGEHTLYDMYRLLGIAKYRDRYRIPAGVNATQEEKRLHQGVGGFSDCAFGGCSGSAPSASGCNGCAGGGHE